VTEDQQRRALLDAAHADTRAVRAGYRRSEEGEHSEALFLTSSYVFPDAAAAAARFSGEQPGNVYSRYTNPTVRTFEERLATLEGAEAAAATGSGMAAILSVCMSLLAPGDHIVCSRGVFGSTTVLLNKYVARFGVKVDFVAPTDLDAWRRALRPETRLLFLETPSNPLCEVADIAALGQLADDAGAWLVVDNCFCTPALQRPLELGAHLVTHSATKYLDGQGRCVGGAVCGREADIAEIVGFLRSAGPSMSPFNAWVFLKGLETLRLRMDAHSAAAQELARWLRQQGGVQRVHYAGLEDHPQHGLARRQQRAYGGVLSFEVDGGRDAAWRLIDATRLLSITANLGDAKTTIIHPASTTHGRLSDEERARQGIGEGLVRVAVGLEHLDDIKADLHRGLEAL
jgi:O-succinylhomoserine sulfhydrylase